ncbi:MAG TPA: histidinol dehydrogenase [Firmicutes bacterium]|nr:histidinol dehydrogenase [Bacillota bacterium]
MDQAWMRANLTRPALDEVAVAPAIEESIQRIFGRKMTPAEVVEQIVTDVAKRGDAAVLEYTWRIDKVKLTPETLFVTEEEIEKAYAVVTAEESEAVKTAIAQVRYFHECQRRQSFFVNTVGGSYLMQRIEPLAAVGCCVPGWRAPLVSTAVMCAVPAAVAGVKNIIASVSPPPASGGRIDERLLFALKEAGVHRILRAGGAQAVAALAYGTETVPKVDKITGPGGVFIQLAKKRVFGRVGIDSLAGPSEIVVIADEEADPSFVAADLLSQAEHDPEAAAILLTPSEKLLHEVLREMERQLSVLKRADTARESLSRWGRAVICPDLSAAVELCNTIAPEHVELMVADPWRWLAEIRHAGAVFLGPFSTEPIGDYVAGTNHILPTNGTARFSSPLGVDDYIRRSSVIAITAEGLKELGPAAVKIGDMEGLDAHAAAVKVRLERLAGNGNGNGNEGK